MLLDLYEVWLPRIITSDQDGEFNNDLDTKLMEERSKDTKRDRKSLTGTAACTTTMCSTLVKLPEEIRPTNAVADFQAHLGGSVTLVCKACFNLLAAQRKSNTNGSRAKQYDFP